MTIRMALAGFGKIARDEHWPAITDNPDFTLAAIATPGADPKIGVPCFPSAEEMFAGMAGAIDAVAICTPPAARFGIAREALLAGLDILLEKPPTATLGELQVLERLAVECGRTIYAGWHAQHAPAVAQAAALLQGQSIAALRIHWHEDVRKWHPGQQWIWQPGGFGVFDPGINAFSIATRLLQEALLVADAELYVPQNRNVPIAASVRFQGPSMLAELDWRTTADEQWTVQVLTDAGTKLELRQGGARLFVDGLEQPPEGMPSYPSLYSRFAELCRTRMSEIDAEPLRIVADIMLKGKIVLVESFD